MADALPVPNRKFLGAAFQDPATLLMVEQLFRQLGSVIPADITGLRNLEFVLTAADTTNAPNGHVVTSGANIGLAVASGLLTIRVVPAGTSGQIQYNNAGALGAFTTSGDATINTSTGVLTLATVNANVGTFGDSTHVSRVTLNAKGLATAASAVAIVGLAPVGGTTGQVLEKNSNTDYDYSWTTPAAAGGTVTHTGALTSGQLIFGNGSADITVGNLSGDISTSGSGVTAIGTNKVTNAMLRQSGALAVVGRSANSTGNVADIQATAASNNLLREKSSALLFDTLSNLIDDAIGSTRGAILERGASGWTLLPPGTSGNALVSNGAGADPSYQPVGASAGGALTLIASQSPTGVSFVTFSSIPSTYTDLILVVRGQSQAAAANDTVAVQFNGDTASNYRHGLATIASTTLGYGSSASETSSIIGFITGTTGVTNDSGQITADIAFYKNTTFLKNSSNRSTIRNADSNGNYFMILGSSWWNSTAAINAIKVLTSSGSNYTTGTVISLYGRS